MNDESVCGVSLPSWGNLVICDRSELTVIWPLTYVNSCHDREREGRRGSSVNTPSSMLVVESHMMLLLLGLSV